MSRNVVITGAAGGIGMALIAAFVDAGDQVIAVDRSQGDAAPQVTWLTRDIASLTGNEIAPALIDDIIQMCSGRCDVLINNAAIQHIGNFAALPMTAWTETLAVNLLAPVALIRALLPLMPAPSGVVINVSSIHAHLTKPGFTAYATSKAALSGLTRALAVELGHRARFVAIEPAAIETPMLRAGFSGDPQGFAQLESMHPAKRLGLPEEVARLAVLLAAPGMEFVNGTAIGIDGGIAARLHDPA